MRNRLATAITLAYDVAIMHMVNEHGLDEHTAFHLLAFYDETVEKLLRGETITVHEGSVSLSDNDETARDYNADVMSLNALDNSQTETTGGYNE